MRTTTSTIIVRSRARAFARCARGSVESRRRRIVTVARRPRRTPRERAARSGALAARRADATQPLSPASLLQLMRLASPSLPVGGFSYSEGLESAVDARLVGDEASAQRWLARPASPRPRPRRPADRRARTRRLAARRPRPRRGVEPLVRDDARDRRAAAPGASRWADRSRSGCAIAATPTSGWPPRGAAAGADVAGRVRPRRADSGAQRARRPRHLRRRLGREHGAGGDQGGAARPGGGAAHPRRARRRDPGRRRRRAAPRRAPTMQAFTPMLAILSARHEEQYSRLFRS